MAELINTFTWSFSADEAFNTCRRKRYWGKYEMWNGWDRRAPEVKKKAYMMTKIQNRYSIQGVAAEDTIMWTLKEFQAGRKPTADEAYETIAKPYLNKCWKESRDQRWKESPKKYCNLQEHYYGGDDVSADWIQDAIKTVKTCVSNFIENIYPRLSHIKAEDEVAVATVQNSSEPEHFRYEDVKIYSIPDYVYKQGDKLHIIDWKSGKPKPEHRYQLGIYGLWATEVHGYKAEDVTLSLEYLAHNEHVELPFSEEYRQEIIEMISNSVGEMSEYLDGMDRTKNIPLPREEWELAENPYSCKFCNFFELCKPELDELGMLDG